MLLRRSDLSDGNENRMATKDKVKLDNIKGFVDFETISFREAINALLPVIPNKPQRDALKCFKIDVTLQGVRISATDLDIYARTELRAGVLAESEFECVVPAQVLAEVIRTVETDRVTVQLQDDDTVAITTEKSKFEIGTQDLDEFPSFPMQPDDEENWVTVAVDELSFALNRVLFAVAEKGHPKWGALSAVSLEIANEHLLFIGTDQRRASLANLRVPGATQKFQVLVNPAGLEVIPKIFTGEIKLYLGEANSLFMKSETSVLISRLIHGNFPPVKSLIPKNNDTIITISPSDLMKQVKKASLATDSGNQLKVEITENKICMSAKAREQRKRADVEYEVQYDGPAIKFAINCQYLMELLKAAAKQDTITLHVGDVTRAPLMFKQDGFCHLLVPQDTK